MKLYYGGLSNETNAFSPIPCTEHDFFDLTPAWTKDPAWSGVFAPFIAGGGTLVWGANLIAQPAGLVTRVAYERLAERLLAEIEQHMPVDGVLLNLHGAMQAEHLDDCEGDLLARVRRLVGPARFVGATLDPHCHLSDAMLDAADALVCYKEYPHTDIQASVGSLLDLCARRLRKEVVLTAGTFDCRQIDIYYTHEPAMRRIVEAMHRLEAEPGVLSVSVVHGFPWGDAPALGTRVLVYTDGDAARADAIASDLGARMTELRGVCGPTLVPFDDVLRAVGDGLTVAADLADNPGGGAAGDSTFLLRALLDAAPGPSALGAIWDPVAVEFATKAGLGSRVRLRVGGKASALSGDPVDLEGEVIGLAANHVERAPGYGDIEVPYGDVAAIRVGEVAVVLTSKRMQVFSPSLFEAVGIDPHRQRLIVVKSTQHFRAGFAPIAARILYVDAPGALTLDYATLPRRRTPSDLWPISGRNES